MTMTLPIIFMFFTVIVSGFNYLPNIDNSAVLIFIGIICLIYWIGSILILVLTCLDSKTESNKYGPSQSTIVTRQISMVIMLIQLINKNLNNNIARDNHDCLRYIIN